MVQNVGHGGAGAGAPAAPEPLLHSFWHGVVGTLFPWELEQQKTTASGTITGVGVIFRQDSSGSLLVHKIVPGGAASRTGMFLVNDELLEVDGKDVQKQPLSEVSALVLGQAGTQVSLTLYRRATGNRVEVSVVRAENPTQHGNFSVVQDDLLRSPNQAVYVAVPSAGQLTALHTVVLLASRSGEEALEEVAGLLVSGRHDVNARDSDGCTPIFYAAGAARTMQLLLNKRAEVNITNRLGNSPLHYAAAANSLVCVEMLVRYGADRTLRNNIGLTPFQLASSLRKDQAAKYLRALDVREERTKAFLPLSEKKMPLNLQLLFAISEEGAVTDGVPVSTLLQAGADPNVKEDETGMYALHLAIFQQSPATVRALLVAGAEPGFIQDGGDYMPPIACALIDRQVTMTDTLDQRMFPALVLRELLEGDCDVNSEIFIMDNVLSPLHMAIINNDLAAAQLLIENGADLDYMDKHGQTPEELASGGFLVPQPPAPTIESLFARRQGEDWPFRSDRSLVIQRREYCRPLMPLPSPLPTSQHELDLLLAQAASEGDRYNVISLVAAGANVDVDYTSKDLKGPLAASTWAPGMDKPLNRACAKGSLRVVEIMVRDLGATINSTGMCSGFSPLHAAAYGGHCNIVRYLIKKGATVNTAIVSDSSETAYSPEPFLGYTPLMLAVLAKDPWTVNELLLAGARNHARGLDQKTARDLLQELTSTHEWDPVMEALASLLQEDATGLQRPPRDIAST